MKITLEKYKLMIEALDISASVKVYGEGREEHQEAIREVTELVTDIFNPF